MNRLKALGRLIFIFGIVIVFTSVCLPLVKLQQTFSRNGPGIALNNEVSYWIDNWSLPPIDKGTLLSLQLESDLPGNLSIVIFPSRNGESISGTNPLVVCSFSDDQHVFSTSAITRVSSEYTISIISVNNTFTLTIDSIWSPFYGLRAYLYLGLGMIPVGLLVIYSSRINESRERAIQEALKNKSS